MVKERKFWRLLGKGLTYYKAKLVYEDRQEFKDELY